VVEKENDRPIAIKCKLPEKAISFREPAQKRELDEQKKMRNISKETPYSYLKTLFVFEV
jgi:hypothetical protein